MPANNKTESPDTIGENIKALVAVAAAAKKRRSLQDRIADGITTFSGRMIFVYVHVLWFGVWIVVNTGKLGVHPFDPYPYGLLTMVVSLEAIFLSTFVLISQNRLAAEADRRGDLALHIGLLTEHELTRVIRMLHKIQNKLGIDTNHDLELLELEKNVSPEDVLNQIALHTPP